MAGVSSEIGGDKAADGVVWSREASHELSLARPSVCMRRRSEFETPCHLHPVHCQHQHLTAAQPHARNSERLGCSSTHVRASSMGDPRINTRWSTMLEAVAPPPRTCDNVSGPAPVPPSHSPANLTRTQWHATPM